MSKTKDMVLVDIYNAEIVRMVTDHLTAKQNRRMDLERKQRDNREHLAKIAMKKGA